MKKNQNNSPYATNKGGFIRAPKPVSDEVCASKTQGEDLRTRGNRK